MKIRRELTHEQKKRLIELDFYHYILHLKERTRSSEDIYDIIETFCDIGGRDAIVIKRQVQEILMEISPLVPIGMEYGILLYKSKNFATTEIGKRSKCNLGGLYEAMYKGLDDTLPPQSKTEAILDEIVSFMAVVYSLGWKGGRVPFEKYNKH